MGIVVKKFGGSSVETQKKIKAVEKAIADGLGMGIDVKNSQGVLVVDVGYDTTEISILSLGGIVLSKLIKTGEISNRFNLMEIINVLPSATGRIKTFMMRALLLSTIRAISVSV